MRTLSALRLLLVLMGLLALSGTARADCASPSGVAGSIIYSANYNQPVWCDGSQWHGFGGGSGGGGTADNLGNHTATQDLDMSGFSVTNGSNASFTGLGNFGSMLVNGGLTATGQASLTTISTSLIQVGDNGASCTSSLAGGVRYNSTSNTIDYCSGSAWLSLGASATTGPAVMTRVAGSGQTVTASTLTKIAFNSTLFDTTGNWDGANKRFIPNIPGKYIVTVGLGCNDSSNCQAHIYKNGSSYQRAIDFDTTTSNRSAVVTAIVDMNGSTDYLEGWGYTNGVIFNGSSVDTYFSAALLAGNATGGGGGTANPAGSTNDVQFNSGGLLAADTGNFTYASSTLTAPAISTGGFTATGVASITTVSASSISGSIIQVGNNNASCASGLAGAVRYNSTSNTIDYCSGSAWLSLGPSATQAISFLVNKNGTDQSVSNNVETALTWSTKVYDTNNNFNTSNGRYTPTIPGKYLFYAQGAFTSTAAGQFISAYIAKNGTAVSRGTGVSSAVTQGITANTSMIVDMNGTTDYVEAHGRTSASPITGDVLQTYFGGVLLTPQGAGSGGTANPAGNTNDVQFNSGGLLAADTGNFTYASSTLTAPAVSTGGFTATGVASITTVSASSISGSIIQVGNNNAACTSGLAGSQRYNTTDAVIEFCNGVSWTSVGPSSGASLTAFTVNNGNQTVAANGIVQWSHAITNNGGGFDTSTGRFTAPATGLYFFIGTFLTNNDKTSPDFVLYKNGSGTNTRSFNNIALNANVNAYVPASLQAVLYLVAGDQIDVRNVNTSAETLEGSVSRFSGFLLNAGTSGGGGTANPAGGTNDVQFNSGGLLAADTGKFTYTPATGTLSATTISTTALNIASVTSVVSLNGGSGNMISSGSAIVSTSSAGSITLSTGGSQRLSVANDGTINFTSDKATFFDRASNIVHLVLRRSLGTLDAPTAVTSNTELGRISFQGYDGTAYSNDVVGMSVWTAENYNSSAHGNWMSFYTVPAGSTIGQPRLTIDDEGYVGVGTQTPSGVPSPGIALAPRGYVRFGNNNEASGFWFASFSRNGTNIGSISQDGTTGVLFNTTSDRRVKEDITDTREGLQKLMELPVRDFAFREDPSHTIVTGFIAQELDKVFPEAVTTNGDNGEVSLTDKARPWSVDYGRVTPLIVKAVQELKVENDSTASRTEILEMQLKAANDNIREMKAEIERLKRTAR